MTDNTFEVDKEEYPLDVLFCPDKEGGYLIEGKDKSGKYRPVSAIKSPIYAPISLKITPPFTYSLNAGSLSGSTFYANAKFSNRWNSLSFFGTKREIKNIYIEIFPTYVELPGSSNGMQLQFRGDLSKKYDSDIGDTEEYLKISMAIKHEEFEKILRLWERDNIGEMSCSLKKELINGLYMQDTLCPSSTYKVLTDRRIVKNYKKLPEHFTDFENFKTYYVSNDCFSLTMRKQKFSQEERETPPDKDFSNEEEVTKTSEETATFLLAKLDEIKKYVQYAVTIMAMILISIIWK